MEIFDIHAHIYPYKIADKAVKSIGAFYNHSMFGDGTAETLVNSGKDAGITKYFVHSAATVKMQVPNINDFIKSECDKNKKLIGFGTLHPDMDEEETEKEVEKMISYGFKGIKLHPDFQKFFIDEEKAFKMYEIIGGRLPILFHTGDNREDYSSPERVVKMLCNFKNQQVIAAHFGAYTVWEKAEYYETVLKNHEIKDNLYFDTSSSIMYLSKEKVKELINEYGSERFFFGSDYPMWSPDKEFERFTGLDLRDCDNQNILSKNFIRFFGTDILK